MPRAWSDLIAVFIAASLCGGSAAKDAGLDRASYSDLCVEAQSGDVSGFRLTVVPEGSRPAWLDFGEGPLRRARVLSLGFTRSTGRLRFVAMDDTPAPASGRFVFSGRRVGRDLVGVMSTPRGASSVRLVATRAGAPPPPCSVRGVAAP